jgi:DNA-binding MarR family transcriptional regulator
MEPNTRIRDYLEERELFRNFAKQHKLSESKLEILAYLGANGRVSLYEKCSSKELLAKLKHYEQSSISKAACDLCRKKLVNKSVSPEVQRNILIWLTIKGKELYQELENYIREQGENENGRSNKTNS